MEEISSGVCKENQWPGIEQLKATYKGLGLTAVLDEDDRLAALVLDLEGEMLDIRLDLGVLVPATNEALSIEDGVGGVHGDLVLGRIADETFRVREGDIRGCRAVALVVGDDFDTVILPYSNAAVDI